MVYGSFEFLFNVPCLSWYSAVFWAVSAAHITGIMKNKKFMKGAVSCWSKKLLLLIPACLIILNISYLLIIFNCYILFISNLIAIFVKFVALSVYSLNFQAEQLHLHFPKISRVNCKNKHAQWICIIWIKFEFEVEVIIGLYGLEGRWVWPKGHDVMLFLNSFKITSAKASISKQSTNYARYCFQHWFSVECLIIIKSR